MCTLKCGKKKKNVYRVGASNSNVVVWAPQRRGNAVPNWAMMFDHVCVYLYTFIYKVYKTAYKVHYIVCI